MNQFRSKTFIKIKHSIQSCLLPTHLASCRQMIENATPILTKDELTILREYMLTACDLIYPVHNGEWDQLLTMNHNRLSS